jgi:hypothetical protein
MIEALELPSPESDRVIRRSDLISAGITHHTLALKCRPGGPWQLLLPGVLLLANSPPTRRQRLRAAVLYAGPDAIITGDEALHEHGLLHPESMDVHVLISIERRVSTRHYVRVERTKRLPRALNSNGLRFAPPLRAAVDAARHARTPDRQRATLFAPIRAGLCTPEQVRTELNAGAQRGTASLRAMLARPATPVLTSTVHQGWARRVAKQCPMPAPQWNVPVYGEADRPLGVADAWWDEVGLAWDFENQRDGRTRARQDAFASAGVITVRTKMPDLRSNPEGVATELTSAFLRAARRPRPTVRAVQ